MIFRQFFDHETCTFTYLLASDSSKEAVLIDPVLGSVGSYTRVIRELGLKLLVTLDTHVHADHITGSGSLKVSQDCQIMMGENSKAEFVDYHLKDNEHLKLKGVDIQAIYTPGHTDDSYSFYWNGSLFTGDTLLIRGTGRTDFQNGNAFSQYHSITQRLFSFKDDTKVYPAHDYNGMTQSTIGEEKRFNPRLKVKSAQEYSELMGNLKLANPRFMDVAIPANLKSGMMKVSKT